MNVAPRGNVDPKTVEGFGEEWAAYTQDLAPEEHRRMFGLYFAIFPFEELPPNAEGFDLGCGSGRWAELARQKVGFLHCIDPSEKALAVTRRRLKDAKNVDFLLADVSNISLADGSQDFGYSLGVLHHIPDPAAGLAACVAKLKPGAPFLLYIYYALENRAAWFRALWKATDSVRSVVSRLPFGPRKAVSTAIAATVYWPLARIAAVAERAGVDPHGFPLAAYRNSSFYTMRTDALDRFGTRLEHRFTREQIEKMMLAAGLKDIRFQDGIPYWVAVGRRST
jgi:ubiquinone/menaquinone biosynthesis C-methylase UbiE